MSAALDHRVRRRISGGIVAERSRPSRCARSRSKRLAHAGQHAQREHVDLQQPEHVEVVLVPLDDGAIVHRRVLDRHQRAQRCFGDHETAGMLRQMPRKAEQLRRRAPARRRITGDSGSNPYSRRCPASARRCSSDPSSAAELRELVRRQAERARHVAHRAAPAIADHRRRQRRAFAAVALEHVLEHFLAPLVLEVDVDVGRFLALLREEALEQHRPSAPDRSR